MLSSRRWSTRPSDRCVSHEVSSLRRSEDWRLVCISPISSLKKIGTDFRLVCNLHDKLTLLTSQTSNELSVYVMISSSQKIGRHPDWCQSHDQVHAEDRRLQIQAVHRLISSRRWSENIRLLSVSSWHSSVRRSETSDRCASEAISSRRWSETSDWCKSHDKFTQMIVSLQIAHYLMRNVHGDDLRLRHWLSYAHAQLTKTIRDFRLVSISR